MELTIPDPTYKRDFVGQGEAIAKFESEVFRELKVEHVDVVSTDIGHGADWPVLLAHISTGAFAAFFLGKPILDNLDAWATLGRRLKSWLKKKGARKAIRIDKEAAALLSLAAFMDQHPGTADIRMTVACHLGARPNLLDTFDLVRHPEQLYVITISKENGPGMLYIFKSDATAVLSYQLPPLDYWQF